MKKAFAEQVISMDIVEKKFLKCETQFAEVKSDCKRLDLAVNENTQHINRLETVVKVNETEVEGYGDKIKNIDGRFENLKKEFHKRTATTVI